VARRRSVRRVLAVILASALFCLASAAAHGQTAPSYAELFYPSTGLRIQAYLYKPEGEGPFPAVIYNHGSREGRERASVPFEHIGAWLSRAGYVVLVPERRGYGRSDGPTWLEAVGRDRSRFVARLHEETDDVLAAADYLRTQSFLDPKRVAVMGWSFGGIVTMFAASRSPQFGAAIDQAGGALTWNGNPDIRAALMAAAERVATPTLLQVAENDRTTASITTLGAILERRGVAHRTVVYASFVPAKEGALAPGHLLFSAQGLSVWQGDVLDFLARHVGATSSLGR
jgi:dienelactone hydrolase